MSYFRHYVYFVAYNVLEKTCFVDIYKILSIYSRLTVICEVVHLFWYLYFMLLAEPNIESIIGLEEFNGHEGINFEFNKDDFFLDVII